MAKFIGHQGKNYQGKILKETEHHERMGHTTDDESMEGVEGIEPGACHAGTPGKTTKTQHK